VTPPGTPTRIFVAHLEAHMCAPAIRGLARAAR